MTRTAKTPSFVTELPLEVNAEQERIVLARLEAARQVYNACLGEALGRREALVHRSAYQAAKTMPAGKARTQAFRQAREAVGFSDYALQDYAGVLGHSWIGKEHLDSLTVQKLASRAFDAVEKYHFHKRGRPRFKGTNQLDSVEGKTRTSGIRWVLNQDGTGQVEWRRGEEGEKGDLKLRALIDWHDHVIAHGLQARVKYVRIVRRKLNGRNRFYVQLVCEGSPYRKAKHVTGNGQVGLDIGPSTIGIVSPSGAELVLFCDKLRKRDKESRRLQRQLDRQRRANNPDNYNQNGTIRQGKKQWVTSKRQRDTERKLSELHRKQAAHRASLHGQLVNHLLTLGNDVRMEKLSYRAFQRRFGRSVAFRAPGTFVSLLRRKAGNAGAALTEFSTHTTKLSQTCHHCGKIEKKPLSQRWHDCECGVSAQRDLYSAFLATHVENDRLNADQAQAAWSGVDTLLRAALSDAQAQLANGGSLPASFGLNRRGASRPAKLSGQTVKTNGAVGETSAPVDAVREAVHPSEPPAFRHGE